MTAKIILRITNGWYAFRNESFFIHLSFAFWDCQNIKNYYEKTILTTEMSEVVL